MTLRIIVGAAIAFAAGVFGPGAATAAGAADSVASRTVPIFEVDRGWPRVPPNFKVGDVSAIAIDSHDNAWVLSRPRSVNSADKDKAAPPVMVFDPAGNYVKGWGGPGAGYEWPEREHSIYIDNKGFVWIGGNYCRTLKAPGLKQVNDDQLLKFTQGGTFVMQIGHSDKGRGNADTENFDRPADMRVWPLTNELFVADGYGNHRVAVLDADTGQFKRMWGAFGKPPRDDSHCGQTEPDKFEGDGPANFGTVHGIRLSNDGIVYVADRENRRIQAFTTGGRFLRQATRYDAIFARNLALSADPGQAFVYSGYGKGIAVLDRKTLTYLGVIQPSGIIGAGHLIESDSSGNLYIAGASQGMQRLMFKGMGAAPVNDTQ